MGEKTRLLSVISVCLLGEGTKEGGVHGVQGGDYLRGVGGRPSMGFYGLIIKCNYSNESFQLIHFNDNGHFIKGSVYSIQ